MLFFYCFVMFRFVLFSFCFPLGFFLFLCIYLFLLSILSFFAAKFLGQFLRIEIFAKYWKYNFSTFFFSFFLYSRTTVLKIEMHSKYLYKNSLTLSYHAVEKFQFLRSGFAHELLSVPIKDFSGGGITFYFYNRHVFAAGPERGENMASFIYLFYLFIYLLSSRMLLFQILSTLFVASQNFFLKAEPTKIQEINKSSDI